MLTNQPSSPSFNFEYLKKVIMDLEQAKGILNTEEKEKKEKKEKEAVSRSGVSSLSPQLKREKFAKEVVGTSLFKDLQQEFFKIIPKMGQEILTVCQSAYNKGTLTNEQRDALATIGNNLATELPFKILSGSVDVKEGFGNFIGILRTVRQFFTDNQSIAVSMGEKALSIFEPLENFVESTANIVREADNVPDSIKEGFNSGLNQIKAQSTQVKAIIQSAIKNNIRIPSADLTKLPVVSPLIKKLQENLLPAIFPIGGAILNVGFSLFNSGILKPEQRDELVDIGKGIMSLPYQLLTGKIDFMGVLAGLTDGLKALGNFFIKNPDIIVRAGATILPAMLPCGGFLTNALQSEFVQDAMGSVLKKGLGLLSKQFENVEGTLEASAQRVLQSPRITGD